MDFNKLKDQLSDEDKQKLMEKADELKKDFGNKVGERFGFGNSGEQPQNKVDGVTTDASTGAGNDDIAEDETEVASTDIDTEDSDDDEIDEDADEENAA